MKKTLLLLCLAFLSLNINCMLSLSGRWTESDDYYTMAANECDTINTYVPSPACWVHGYNGDEISLSIYQGHYISMYRNHKKWIPVDSIDTDLRTFILNFVIEGKGEIYPEFNEASLGIPATLFLYISSYDTLHVDGIKSGFSISCGVTEIDSTKGDAEIDSYGDIEVNNHTGNIVAKTTKGTIDATIIMPDEDGICQFKSDSGDVSVAVPNSVGATIKLEVIEGSITIDDAFGELEDTNPDENIFESVVGDSSGTIYLKSGNGNVRLNSL